MEFAHEKFGVERLEDLSRHEFKAFIEDGIARRLAASTLETRCSHLAKLGALIGKTESFASLSRKLASRIRELASQGVLREPERSTPTPEVANRAIEILRAWDEKYTARTGKPRGSRWRRRVGASR